MEPGTSSCQDLQCGPLVPFLRWPESHTKKCYGKVKSNSSIIVLAKPWCNFPLSWQTRSKKISRSNVNSWRRFNSFTNKSTTSQKILLFIFVLWKNSLERACRCNIIWFVEVYWFRLVNSTLTSANRTTFLLCCCWFSCLKLHARYRRTTQVSTL